MLNVLILSNHLTTTKKIINNIVINIPILKITGISNTPKEALKLLEKSQAELIITTNPILIKEISEKFLNYNPYIVIIQKIPLIKRNSKKRLYLDFNLSFYEMTVLINNFIKQKSASSEKEYVMKILKTLGFNFKLKGTWFLLESILYAHSFEGSHSFEQIKRDIYGHVANNNLTNSNIVKWAISRSINYMYNHHTQKSYKSVEDYFKIEYPEKITPKLVINYISNSI